MIVDLIRSRANPELCDGTIEMKELLPVVVIQCVHVETIEVFVFSHHQNDRPQFVLKQAHVEKCYCGQECPWGDK